MQFIFDKNKLYSLFVFLTLFLGLNRVGAQSVTLSWSLSPDSSVTGYNVYYGTTSGNYTNKVTVGNLTNVTISNLVPGITYYFAATAFDAFGDESDLSNETQFIVTGILTLSLGLNPGDPMSIKFPIAPMQWDEVQATSDFKSWTTIWQTDVSTSNAWIQFFDPQTSQFASRFYRLVMH